VEAKVKAMTNRADVAFYGDNDSIAIMEEGYEASEAGSTKYSLSKSSQLLASTTTNHSTDNRSIASSVI
jgi:hypothetical protein